MELKIIQDIVLYFGQKLSNPTVGEFKIDPLVWAM